MSKTVQGRLGGGKRKKLAEPREADFSEVGRIRGQGFGAICALQEALARHADGSPQGLKLSIEAVDAIWDLAGGASLVLEELLTDNYPEAQMAEVLSHIRQRAPHEEGFPVFFNQRLSLEPYIQLKIGHEIPTACQNPSIRGGNSPFRPYAVELVRRLRVLRAEQRSGLHQAGRATSKPTDLSKASETGRRTNRRKARKNLGDDAGLLTQIHDARPEDLTEIGDLPVFERSSAKKWAACAKALFKIAFLKPESISSLASTINDGDVEYESQIRSRIVERIGRAVVALAR
mgnify:CR=1 FL=1